MPGKIKVTKEMIIEKSLEITRKEGINSCNARRIGEELHCSLQPVYYYFKTMNNLREEIILAARKLYNSYIEETKKCLERRFKAVGEMYILFAIKEKELFKLLFMSKANIRVVDMLSIDDNTPYIRKELMNDYQLTEEQAARIHYETWIFTHGIASMLASEYMTFSSEEIGKLLSDVFLGLLMKVKGEKGND